MDTNADKGLEGSILYAKKYLEDLLSFFGLNIDVHATTEDEQVIELNVPSTHMNGFLIGNHAETMRSFQYVVSMALKTNDYEVVRVNVDIAEYKKQRASRLEDRAQIWLKEVKESGVAKHLEPMNPADPVTSIFISSHAPTSPKKNHLPDNASWIEGGQWRSTA